MDGPTSTANNVTGSPEQNKISESLGKATPVPPTEDGDKQFFNDIQNLYAFLAQAIHLF